MVKYVILSWPEIQKFMDHPRWSECRPLRSDCAEHVVPEDLYEEVMYKLQFPKKYENTNLGTIICYETRAVVNGEDIFWYDLSNLKRGDKVLIYNHDIPSGYNKPKWFITTCKCCHKGFPIILEDSVANPGIDCEIIGVKANMIERHSECLSNEE